MKVTKDNQIAAHLLDREQRAVHGLAWIATTVRALVQRAAWAQRLEAGHRFGEAERLLMKIAFGEYLAQFVGGLAMSQNEFVRPLELGLDTAAMLLAKNEAVDHLLRGGNTAESRAALMAHIVADRHIDEAAGDETLDMIRDQLRR